MTEINNKYKITILTPTAVTYGKSIDSFEYLIRGNYFYRLDVEKILNHLIKEYPEAIHKISDWVEHKEELINQKANESRKTLRLNVFDFVKRYLRKPELNQWLEQKIINDSDFIKYKIPSYLENKYERQISTHIKTADNKIYIPGSTIKGLIRTALINDYLYSTFEKGDTKEIDELKNKINDYLNRDQVRIEHFAQEVISDYFKFRSGKYDAKNDIMKFIRVSDTNSLDPTDVCEVVHPIILTIKGREQQRQLNALEVIKSGVTFEFTIDIDIDFLRNTIKAANGDNKIKEDDKRYLDNTLKLLNITQNEIQTKPNSFLVNKVYQTIEDSLYNYLVFVSEKNESFIQNNKQFKLPQSNENDILAQIGWGSGFHTKTILFNFLNNFWGKDNSLKDIYRQIFQKFNISRINKRNSQYSEMNLDAFPTSRRLVKINNFYQQLGWTKIERIQ